jgi:hypothetical protein
VKGDGKNKSLRASGMENENGCYYRRGSWQVSSPGITIRNEYSHLDAWRLGESQTDSLCWQERGVKSSPLLF